MFAGGFLILAVAVWLADSAIQNRSPIATLEAIIKDPKNTRTTLTATKGTAYTSTTSLALTASNTPTPTDANPTGSTASAVAQAAVAYAEAQIGKPYRLGATGPDAFDCSGLCYAAYLAAGLKIPRTTAEMLVSKQGKAVPRIDLQPGDLVLPYPGHVFMYVGGGQAVEAPHTGTSVHYTNVYSFFTARRYA